MGPTSPWSGHVFFLGFNGFGVGLLAFCLQKKKKKNQKVQFCSRQEALNKSFNGHAWKSNILDVPFKAMWTCDMSGYLKVFFKFKIDLKKFEHRECMTTWLVFLSSRVTISRLGIEPPTAPFSLGTSPLSSSRLGSSWTHSQRLSYLMRHSFVKWMEEKWISPNTQDCWDVHFSLKKSFISYFPFVGAISRIKCSKFGAKTP